MSIRANSFTLECKKALDRASEIFQDNEGCFLYTPTQVFHAVKKMLTSDQQARFEDAIRTENTTLGVAGYEPDSSETLSETAKTLSLSSYSVVISDENERTNMYSNKRIIAVTPKEFLSYCDEAKRLSDALSKTLKDTAYPDYLILVLFRKDVCETLKKLVP